MASKFELRNSSIVHVAVFLFPALIATVRHGGGAPYLLLFLLGLVLGWSAWSSLESWEKKLLFGFVIFFALISLSLIHTDELRDGFKKIERYIHFPLLIPMYLLLKKFQIETGKTFLYGLVLASLVMFLLALYQLSELGYYRSAGAYNPIILGDVSMLFAMIILGVLVVMPHGRLIYLFGAITVGLALMASFMSGSRGAWILLPFVLLWLVWLQRENLTKRRLLFVVIAIAILVCGVFQIGVVSEGVNRAISNYHGYAQDPSQVTSVGARFEMWKDAIAIWKENPVLGVGLGDYHASRLQLYGEEGLEKNLQFGHAHSIYFDVLATAGTVGFLAMVIFVLILPFRMFYSFWQTEKDSWLRFYALSGMTTILAFAIFGLTEAWLARNPFVRTYLMCVLVFMSSIAVRKASLSASVVDASSKEQA